jgi:hypothetical protein
MQIGVTVVGFKEIDGILFYELNVKIPIPGVRGELTGTVPFNATIPQAQAAVKAWIKDSYNITVPPNADVKVVGL